MKKTIMVMGLLCALCWTAQADVYIAEDIADAIYKAEGGNKAIKSYGILSVSCADEVECRKVCINTIQNNFTRWQVDNKGFDDFLEYLAHKYAPVGAGNDPRGLNKNWIKNVKFFLKST